MFGFSLHVSVGVSKCMVVSDRRGHDSHPCPRPPGYWPGGGRPRAPGTYFERIHGGIFAVNAVDKQRFHQAITLWEAQTCLTFSETLTPLNTRYLLVDDIDKGYAILNLWKLSSLAFANRITVSSEVSHNCFSFTNNLALHFRAATKSGRCKEALDNLLYDYSQALLSWKKLETSGKAKNWVNTHCISEAATMQSKTVRKRWM